MAKVKLNDLLQEVRGTIGNLTIRRTRHGLIVTPKAIRRRRWSDQQVAQREKLQLARIFYRRQMAKPDRAAWYRARAKELGWPVSSYVMGGYLKHGEAFAEQAAPQIDGVGDGRDGADCD